MRRAATALLLLLAQAMHARAVQLYYGLDELEDLAKTEIVDKEGRVLKHTLLAFSNHACREADSYAKGFPWSFSHLPGEGFELGQVGGWVGPWVDGRQRRSMPFHGMAPHLEAAAAALSLSPSLPYHAAACPGS